MFHFGNILTGFGDITFLDDLCSFRFTIVAESSLEKMNVILAPKGFATFPQGEKIKEAKQIKQLLISPQKVIDNSVPLEVHKKRNSRSEKFFRKFKSYRSKSGD
jgi:hypothetical protein